MKEDKKESRRREEREKRGGRERARKSSKAKRGTPGRFVDFFCLSGFLSFFPFLSFFFLFSFFLSFFLSSFLGVAGRGAHTHAHTHSLLNDHHVFLNLATLKFYCLPDNYEVIDPSLEDIKVGRPKEEEKEWKKKKNGRM